MSDDYRARCEATVLDGAPEGTPLVCVLEDGHDGRHVWRYPDGREPAP